MSNIWEKFERVLGKRCDMLSGDRCRETFVRIASRSGKNVMQYSTAALRACLIMTRSNAQDEL